MSRKIAVQFIGCIAIMVLLSQASLGCNRLFLPAQVYDSAGWTPFSIAVDDVNGDGRPDLLVVNLCFSMHDCGIGGVAVLLGNGDGTFHTAETYRSGGAAAEAIATGDLNGDTKPDIVVVNQCSDAVHCPEGGRLGILFGNGDGTFQAAVSYATGGQRSSSVAIADMNHDGNADLIVSNYDTVGVLLGNGDGTFQAAQNYALGGGAAASVVVRDVNGDGKPDVLVAQCFDHCAFGTVAVLLGNGNGTFEPVKNYDSGGFSPRSIAAEDVNGDGKLDLLVANEYNDYYNPTHGITSVLIGNGDGTFQAPQTYESGGFRARSVAVADVSGDGKPDLLVANSFTSPRNPRGRIDVMLGNGDGTFQPALRYRSGGANASSLAVNDVNLDGKPDLLLANDALSCGGCETGVVSVLLGTARFATTTNLTSNPNPAVYGQPVKFTTVVTSVAPYTPTGTITFKIGADWLGKATLTAGVATLTKKNLPIGTHSITARYSGDTKFAPSTSQVLIQVVNP